MKKLFYLKLAFFVTLLFGVNVSFAANTSGSLSNDTKRSSSSSVEKQIEYISNYINTANFSDTSQFAEFKNNFNSFSLGNEDTSLFFLLKYFNKFESTSSTFVNFYYEEFASLFFELAYKLRIVGDTYNAKDCFEQSLALYKEVNNKKHIAECYDNLGRVLASHGEVEEALEYIFRAIKIREEIGAFEDLGDSYNEIGAIHFNQNNFDKALTYFLKSIKVYKKYDHKAQLADSYWNLAHIYINAGDTLKFRDTLRKSAEIYLTLNNAYGNGSYAYVIGVVHNTFGNYDSTIVYFKKAIKHFKEIDYATYISSAYLYIARVYLLLQNYSKAEAYGDSAFLVANNINSFVNLKTSSSLLLEVYEKQNRGMEALEMHKKHIAYRDSIKNISIQKSIFQNEVKYKYEKQKALDDAENDKRIAVEKEKQQRQFIVLMLSVSGGAIVAILLLIIYRRLQLTRKQKIIIEEQKEEVETQRDQIEEQRDDIMASISYAKRIQEAILPSLSQIKELLPNSFVLYQPKDVVAGDFYWQESINNKVYIAAADCTGHGVPGALVSVVCSNALTKSLLEEGHTDVGKILDRTRELVIERLAKSGDIKDGMDISLACLDFATMKLEWAGANNPLYLLRNGEIEITKGDREPIGYTENPTPFTKHIIELQKGDTIYLFTDGYADQFGGPEGKKMGYKKFREKLVELSTKEMIQQQTALKHYFEEWKGAEDHVDDVCVVGIKV